MKIIISPAKKMNTDTDTFPIKELPVLLNKTTQIQKYIQDLSYDQAKKLWNCNDRLAGLNYARHQDLDLYRNLTPAILAYEGIQYQYMVPVVFTENALRYIDSHLYILSGFYGVLRPFDGVTPYRLEMQAKARVGDAKDLYAFWGDSIYQTVTSRDHVIINLASKEYAKCVEEFLRPEDTFITCIFGEWKDQKIIQKGTQAKMARGEMVRFLAENQIERTERIKDFCGLGYSFRESLSSDKEYVFLK